MIITIPQEVLKAGLAVVGRAANARATLPILANVLLEANGSGQLKLSATNLQLILTCWLPADITKEGTTTLPADTMAGLVSNLPGGGLTLTRKAKTETVALQAAQSKASVKGLPADEFPPNVAPKDAHPVTLAAAVLKQLVRRTVFSAATDEARPTLTGVLFALSGDRLTLSSADGFRLSTMTATLRSLQAAGLPEGGAPDIRAIIPGDALKELLTVLPEEGTVEMQVAPKRVTFRASGLDGPLRALELTSLLVEGEFPDFSGMLPTGHTTRVTVDRQALLRACRQALIFARDNSYAGKFTLAPGTPGSIVVSARSAETGSNQATVDAEVEGEGLEIAFNIHYLQEALQILSTPRVVLELTTPQSPGVLRGAGETEYTHLIMPLHS